FALIDYRNGGIHFASPHGTFSPFLTSNIDVQVAGTASDKNKPWKSVDSVHFRLHFETFHILDTDSNYVGIIAHLGVHWGN
ncbi:hypothetical protein PFISCL1PPCAC_21061, partial [Pristionchus fissidentatus]